jgi:hypothetical protein
LKDQGFLFQESVQFIIRDEQNEPLAGIIKRRY